MLRYLVWRLASLVPVLIGISLLAFILLNLTPGDPADTYLRRLSDTPPTPAQLVQTRRLLGLDYPAPVRYGRWLWGVAHGDLGRSYRTRGPASTELVQHLPATLELAVAALLLALVIALPLGILTALRRGSILDHGARVAALLGASLPSFWLALLLITLFSVRLGWLPVAGQGGPEHLILPAVTLAAGTAAGLTRLTRAGLLEVLNEDYIRTARAKGLRGETVVIRHALRNALIGVVTVIGISFGHLIGGAAIVETIFAWPGIGKLVVDAIGDRDYPLIQGFVLFSVVSFLFVNFLVDLSYLWLDPRVRLGGAGALDGR
ncbi:MAG: nickel ABC transporter permease [Dehalococcoidia bacterium]